MVVGDVDYHATNPKKKVGTFFSTQTFRLSTNRCSAHHLSVSLRTLCLSPYAERAKALTTSHQHPPPAGDQAMSPRATDGGMRVAVPAPAPSPIAITSHHENQHGREGGHHARRTRTKKPLSSGFKAIVWTSPPPVMGLSSTAPAAASSQRRESPRAGPSPKSRAQRRTDEKDFRTTKTDDVDPVTTEGRRQRSNSGGGGMRRSPRTSSTAPQRGGYYNGQNQLTSVGEWSPESGRQQEELLPPYPTAPPQPASIVQRRAIGAAKSEEWRALQHLPPPAAVEGTGMDSSVSQSMPHALPALARRGSSDAYGNPIMLERSFSDTSVVTASDFGGPPRFHRPTILASTQMSDEDAIEELVALLAKGKGLPVVKHASGMGGKSRKLLKLNQQQQGGWNLSVCGMLPPYFKTKIAMNDVDRVESKWCCVVVHSRGRSPVRDRERHRES